MNSVPFQPNMHSAVAAGVPACGLAFADLFGQREILCRHLHSLYIPIVTTARDAEEAAHFADAVLLPVTVYHLVFYAGLHSFPVSERKPRNSSTSIFNRLFSYLYSCKVLAGFRPRCFGMLNSLSFRFSLYNRPLMVLNVFPYSRASSRALIPSLCFLTISSLTACGMFGVPFCLCIAKPPIAVSILQ